MRRGFLPQAFVLAGLAIAIVCWGFGYRLSAYQLYPTSTAQTAAAKLCVEPRNSALAAASQLGAIRHFAEIEADSPSKLDTLSRVVSGPVHLGSPDPYRSATFDFLIPFRSPPPQRFLA